MNEMILGCNSNFKCSIRFAARVTNSGRHNGLVDQAAELQQT